MYDYADSEASEKQASTHESGRPARRQCRAPNRVDAGVKALVKAFNQGKDFNPLQHTIKEFAEFCECME